MLLTWIQNGHDITWYNQEVRRDNAIFNKALLLRKEVFLFMIFPKHSNNQSLIRGQLPPLLDIYGIMFTCKSTLIQNNPLLVNINKHQPWKWGERDSKNAHTPEGSQISTVSPPFGPMCENGLGGALHNIAGFLSYLSQTFWLSSDLRGQDYWNCYQTIDFSDRYYLLRFEKDQFRNI